MPLFGSIGAETITEIIIDFTFKNDSNCLLIVEDIVCLLHTYISVLQYLRWYRISSSNPENTIQTRVEALRNVFDEKDLSQYLFS